MRCIDLQRRFGSEFKIVEEGGERARKASDRWSLQIACRHGHICPWGGELLAACTVKRGPTIGRLLAIPGAILAQDGDDGANITFPLSAFDAVAAVMRPRRRRKGKPLSAEHREKLITASAAHRFKRAG